MDNSQYSRRAAPPTTWAIWREHIQENWGVLLIPPLLIVMVASIVYGVRWRTRDLADSPMRSGHAVIESMIWSGAEGRAWDLRLRLNGRSVVPQIMVPDAFNQFRAGDTIDLEYRESKSGLIYVYRVSDVPGLRKHQAGTNPASR
jgi:hypothetical protein